MPAHIRSDRGLTVSFHREGIDDDERVQATNGERALKAAILLLAKLDDLRDGDWLMVRAR
jgi:hypothetical protein